MMRIVYPILILEKGKLMDIENVYAARERLKPYLSQTPLLYSELLSQKLAKQIWLKLETQQMTGSFKTRPALNSILSHLDKARQHGVIASSSGNFAQGVAYAAHLLGVKAMIVMPENTSPFKIQRTKNHGAEVVLCGNTHESRVQTTAELQKKTGRLLLHPYDSLETMAGDGTIGLEISEQLGDQLTHPVTILVPVSGGGLIAGIALAIKTLHPQFKVIGLQSTACGSLLKSMHAGHCVNVGSFKTIADALVASEPGQNSFKIIQRYVDDVVLIEEEEIRTATSFFIDQHKLVVEPAGALPLAALLNNKIDADRVVCIVSGGNILLTPKF